VRLPSREAPRPDKVVTIGVSRDDS
jgi:hypothetical protein